MTQPTPRQRIENLWDRATPIGPLLDAYRDDIAIDIGRDALRDGLQHFLARLVGKANTRTLLADVRAAALHAAADRVALDLTPTGPAAPGYRHAIADVVRLLRRLGDEEATR